MYFKKIYNCLYLTTKKFLLITKRTTFQTKISQNIKLFTKNYNFEKKF